MTDRGKAKAVVATRDRVAEVIEGFRTTRYVDRDGDDMRLDELLLSGESTTLADEILDAIWPTGPEGAPGRPKRLLARIEEVGDPNDVRTVHLTEARLAEALDSYVGGRWQDEDGNPLSLGAMSEGGDLERLAEHALDQLWECAEDPVPEGDPGDVALADEELVRRAVANARIAATLVRFREDLNLHNEISDDELARLGADVLAVSLAHGSSSVGPRAFRPEPQGLTDEELVRRAVRVAGWRGPLRPRWAAVRDSFGCGSTVASALCSRFGLNPDEEVGAPTEEQDPEGER